jgi:hypothetical protein
MRNDSEADDTESARWMYKRFQIAVAHACRHGQASLLRPSSPKRTAGMA